MKSRRMFLLNEFDLFYFKLFLIYSPILRLLSNLKFNKIKININ